ncbi:MAG TPA: endolytic transglycosylase MltG [Nitrospiraceae bacterium]|nr:endolytic transglycosylase MltG [Nitrospiraceae bacterium]
MKNRFLLWLLAFLCLAGAAGYQVLRWGQRPVVSPAQQPPTQIVVIPEGSSYQQVASLLKREHLIRSRIAFNVLGRFKAADRKIHPGEYELNAAMSAEEILTKLLAGRVVMHPITIPEGFTMTQIGQLLGQLDITDTAEFLRLAHDPAFIESLGFQAASLEGYLFPETYYFARETKAKEVIRTMAEGVKRLWTAEFQEQSKRLNLTQHEVLTLASVIEKETGVQEERELVAAVFHNRLRRKIPLQSDPTVIYGLTAFDGNLRKRDLTNSSPYNTYRVQGLPPGPIASPGAHSIRAALFPSRASYLYFVSRNDGTHYFSSSLEEHNRAVERFQKQPFRRQSRAGIRSHRA